MRLLPILLVALLCGCASSTAVKPKPAPVAARKSPPLPPLPPGFTLPVKAKAAPVQSASLLFRPASVGQSGPGTNSFIIPFGADAYLVGFWQQSNSTMTMQYAENITAADWEFLALYGAVPSAQYVAAAIPANWTQSGRLFTRGINEPAPPVSMLFADIERDTKRTVRIHGRNYKLWQLGQPNAVPFQVFRLKP